MISFSFEHDVSHAFWRPNNNERWQHVQPLRVHAIQNTRATIVAQSQQEAVKLMWHTRGYDIKGIRPVIWMALHNSMICVWTHIMLTFSMSLTIIWDSLVIITLKTVFDILVTKFPNMSGDKVFSLCHMNIRSLKANLSSFQACLDNTHSNFLQ